jgi:hypothetical protein
MVEYDQIIEKIISSVMCFDFKIDFEGVKSKMELREIPSEELEKLTTDEIKKNFSNGEFKIKQSNGNIIDSTSSYKYSEENNISEPIVNPNFKYVRWEITEDLSSQQLKDEIKYQLSSNPEINLERAQKTLITKEIEANETIGNIYDISVKVSSLVEEGIFYLRSTCSRESAVKLINEVINELRLEREKYVVNKLKTDKLYSIIYALCVVLIASFWYLTNQNLPVNKWLSISIAVFIFVVPFILRLLQFSFIDAIFFKDRAKKKYEKEFNYKVR